MSWWNPFDWFSTNDNEDEDEDEGWEENVNDEHGEYDSYGDAGEVMKIARDPSFDEWDQKGQIPKTNPPRYDPPDTGPLKRKWR